MGSGGSGARPLAPGGPRASCRGARNERRQSVEHFRCHGCHPCATCLVQHVEAVSGRATSSKMGSEGRHGERWRKEPRVGGARARIGYLAAAWRLLEVVRVWAAVHSTWNCGGRSEALELSGGGRAEQMGCCSRSRLADMCMHVVDVCTACQHLGRRVLGRHSLSTSR